MGERDDTRDIAIEARASSSSAHHRLDGYNGQIARLARAVEGTNAKLDEALNDPSTGLRAEISNVKGDMRVHAAKLAVMVAVVSLVFGATTSAVASHFFQVHQQQHPATSQASR